MIISLLLGLIVVIGTLWFLNWYGKAKTEDVKKTIRWTGIGLGLLVVGLLAVTGRLGVALAFLTGLAAWAWRVFNMIQMGHQMSSMFRGFAHKMGGGATTQASNVESAFLRMTLDHTTGHLDGEVVKGTFTGQKLGALTIDQLLKVLTEARADAESSALMESYLDRAHPDWRARGYESSQTSAPTATTSMSEDEALLVLGLKSGASPDDIKSAYRRLMTQMHPDRGGSDYLAAKINAAKAVLLKE
jgi:hypothetical protein